MNKRLWLLYLFNSIVFIFFFIGIHQRTLVPPVPYDIPDCYYCPMVSYLNGLGFNRSYRTPVYPLIFFITSYSTDSFSTLVYLQVLIGIVTSLLLLFFFNKIIFSKNFYLSIINSFLSLLLLYSFLFSNSKIDFEFSIRPEIFSHLFMILTILLIERTIIKKYNIDKTIPLLIFISLFVAYYQDKFIGITILNLIIVFKLFIDNKHQNIKSFFIYILSPIIIFSFCYITLQKVSSPKSDINQNSERNLWGYNALFWRNQDSIIKLIKKDYNNPNFTRYSKDILDLYIKFYDIDISSYYPQHDIQKIQILDHINNDLSPTLNLSVNLLQTQDEVLSFRRYYFYRSLITYPSDYLKKYFRQIWNTYKPFNSNIFLYNHYFLTTYKYKEVEDKFINDTYNLNRKIPIINKYYYQVIAAKNTKEDTFSNTFINNFYKLFNQIYTPVTLIFIFVFLKNKNSSENKKLGLLSLYSLVSAFLMHSYTCFFYLTLNRYLAEIFPLFLLSLFLMFYYLLLNLIEILKKTKN